MPNTTRQLLTEIDRKRAVAAARQDLAQARAGKLPAVDLDRIARGAGFTKTDPVAGLWTRRDLCGLIQHLSAARPAAPATTRPAVRRPLAAIVPASKTPASQTPLWDQFDRLSGSARTGFYRLHKKALDQERRNTNS